MRTVTFRTVPGLRLPLLSKGDLENLLQAAKQFNISHMKITPGAQLSVSETPGMDFPGLVSFLETFMQPMSTNGIDTLFTCSGCQSCRRDGIDTQKLTEGLVNLVLPVPLPAKVKAAVASCSKCCTMPRLRDVGLYNSGCGWTVSFGGNGGKTPRIGDIIAEKLEFAEALSYARACLYVYCEHALPGQRTSRYLEKTGIRDFQQHVVEKKWAFDPGQRKNTAL